MRLEEATAALLEIRKGEGPEKELWEKARGEFAYVLFANADEGSIRAALELDVGDVLPVDLKRAAYERLLEAGRRSPQDLKNYAWYLQLHGPEWDTYADALLEEAEESTGNDA